MTTTGNILLGCIALLYLLFVTEFYLKPAPRGGDAVVGYAWGIMLFHVALLVLFGMVAAIVGAKGGFQWIGSGHFFWVTGGLLLAVLGGMIAAFKEGPGFVQVSGGLLALVIPVCLWIGLVILLNAPATPAFWYRWPLMLAVGAGSLVCGSMLVIYLKSRGERALQLQATQSESEIAHEADMMRFIDAVDVMTTFSNLPLYTDGYKSDAVREHALTKMKSRPDWAAELVRGLSENWAPEVFTFLASNEVPDKSLFAAPVREGILMQAQLIRQRIGEATESHDLYADQFCWEIERVLRTIKKFDHMGVDYRSALQALREALDAPAQVEKPTFVCVRELDKWLSKH
jgi:hypothetical protein